MVEDKSRKQGGEPEKERVDRELIEMLNEIRVALPGVQVLFAFLLILPFQQGFAETSDVDRAAFTVALIAPTVPASPTPFTPRTFTDVGVSSVAQTIAGMSLARGIA